MAVLSNHDTEKMAIFVKIILKKVLSKKELILMFKRKAYDKLFYWKENMAPQYAALLEGPRRVSKSTIALEFEKNNYDSYILIDSSKLTKDEEQIFENINDLEFFFLQLQTVKGVTLSIRKSVIIFDEIQFVPKVRAAIKHLVKDGRYDYIETGSFIFINKNVKDILIPSEEHKIDVYPMDYEEFCSACGYNYSLLEQVLTHNRPMGQAVNRKLMRDFRTYMAVGGMPQAVDAFIKDKNFESVDRIKKEILELYSSNFFKIDPSGRLSHLFNSIPSQLANNNKFYITKVTNKKVSAKDRELIFDLLNSKTVLPCYKVNDPSISLNQTKDIDNFKLYLSDIGLFTTMLFNDKLSTNDNIYIKLLSDKLDVNLGYLYENMVAQIIASCDRQLFYYVFKNNQTTRNYEIDFLTTDKNKLVLIEVKSSEAKNHKSINEFSKKYSSRISRRILFSQDDISNDEMLELKPIYLALPIIKELN